MALTEKEQIEIFSHWWKENGLSVVATVAVFLAVYFGWTTWQTHQQTQVAKASEIFQQMIDLQSGKIDGLSTVNMTALADQLKKDYANTYYGQAVHLLLAEDAVKNGKLELAEKELTTLVEQKPKEILLFTARLRLGRVLYAEGKYDAALIALNGSTPEAYKSLFAELRGDAQSAKGDADLARASYAEALSALDKGSESQQQAIEMKLNHLAVSK